MKPLTALLAATDFSATARRAEARAARLAQSHGARLILLHCLPGLEFAQLRAWLPPDGAAEARLRQQAQDALQARASALAQDFGIAVEPRLTEGQPHREIERASGESGVELAVVGAAGEHPLREFFLGSTPERLVRASPVPVLVVRREAHAPYARVLAALDLSRHSPAVLDIARRVAPVDSLTLGHAFEAPFEGKLRYAGVSEEDIQRHVQVERAHALADLNGLVAGWPERPDIRIEHGMPHAVLARLIAETAAELVVAGKHGASEAVDLLLGSMTKHLLREAGCDVLVVPPVA